MAPLSITRAGVAGTVLALVVALVCARLGIWQLDRLEQRKQSNAAMAERLGGATIALPDMPQDTAGLLFRTVEIEGRYDLARSIVLRGRAHEGMPGVHVLTPLRLPDGTAVLVNRGWVPSADAATVDLDALPPPASGRVTGLALPFHTDGAAVADESAFRVTWTLLDLAALRRQFPYALASFYVQALPTDDGAAPMPRPIPAPELDNGPHLGYAVQWFSFAAIALVGWVTLVLRRSAPRPRP